MEFGKNLNVFEKKWTYFIGPYTGEHTPPADISGPNPPKSCKPRQNTGVSYLVNLSL